MIIVFMKKLNTDFYKIFKKYISSLFQILGLQIYTFSIYVYTAANNDGKEKQKNMNTVLIIPSIYK